MARILCLDESHVPSSLRSALGNALRVYDTVAAMPNSHRSKESQAFKNVSMHLHATEPDVNPCVFSESWFAGVSAVRIPVAAAEVFLSNPSVRAEALKRLAKAVPSEMSSADISVGPKLDGDERDCDDAEWECGFDSPSCCVGLYSADENHSADAGNVGMQRRYKSYFLVVKAGGGLAAQTFHTRVLAALNRGCSLDECFAEGADPGAQALRRVSMAATRNRARILVTAASALGLLIDTIPDSASAPGRQYRLAVTDVNVSTNCLRRMDGRPVFHYAAGCIDGATSQGLIASSNVAAGFVLFVGDDGSLKLTLKNEAHNCLPFSTVRLETNRELVMTAAARCKASDSQNAHPDAAWIAERFAWTSKPGLGFDMVPPSLWGSHEPENFQIWGRELGLGGYSAVRLAPEIVAISATEPARLRAAARHVVGAS